ncbi:l-serine ammonia-lyase [Nitritalea halalkaliphila LW7]|uniref:L-serine ammonia-lyase n=1 Tax=Nitritalea halalkaliphila LW7 TaxID=1189621 RepID=I5BYZ0_9BACT|nr:l-serine ammonia-lyase [Nitritalea halalkaliphila LW7]
MTKFLFDSFSGWQRHCEAANIPLFEAVISYEIHQRNTTRDAIYSGLLTAYQVMREAVDTGLKEDMQSRSA